MNEVSGEHLPVKKNNPFIDVVDGMNSKDRMNNKTLDLYLKCTEEKEKCQKEIRHNIDKLTKEMLGRDSGVTRRDIDSILNNEIHKIDIVIGTSKNDTVVGKNMKERKKNILLMQGQIYQDILSPSLALRILQGEPFMLQGEESNIGNMLKMNYDNHKKMKKYLGNGRISEQQVNAIKKMLPQDAQKVLEKY